MNKNLIALAVAAATFSGAASAATVYSDDTSSLAIGGRVEARALSSENGTTQVSKDQFKTYKEYNQALVNQHTSNDVTDISRVRVNIDAKTQIADGVQGIGYFEREFTANTNNDENRYIYAGVNSDKYGQIVYGKADGSLGMLTDFTDIMAYAGSVVGSSKLAVADRTSNNLAYAGTFNNLTFKANYVFDGAAYNSTTGQKTNQSGFSTAAKYAVGNTGLALGVGYAQQKDQTAINQPVNQTSKQTFAVASYTVGDLYFGGLYKYGHRDATNLVNGDVTDSQGYEFAAAYTMGKAVFTTTYGFMKDERNTSGAYDELANALSVDGTYYFNSNFRTYASYTFNMLDKNKVGKVAASDQIVLGARYDF
ncbi:porin [Photobacterium kishitanii]|uniref:porin n=1 Tax=Photobacterium kishitanii TaxID=318456 RepID=UPI0005D394D7|nr:porin [Photobacterium kishitanii]KJG09894.1 membrane protein [Photobacterium kishitanii]PSV05662.1 porin [Photobacterium kishitanii]PSV75193.1 porin [Photobacterium kishitanii]